jgi:hypothetical protein
MKTKIFDQHSEHNEWINKLLFYDVEMKIMQKRLDEAVVAELSQDNLKQIEHFQNQIFIQGKHISDLTSHIKGEEKVLQANISQNTVASDHRLIEDHAGEREQVQAFEKIFNDLRKEFNSFLSLLNKH